MDSTTQSQIECHQFNVLMLICQAPQRKRTCLKCFGVLWKNGYWMLPFAYLWVSFNFIFRKERQFSSYGLIRIQLMRKLPWIHFTIKIKVISKLHSFLAIQIHQQPYLHHQHQLRWHRQWQGFQLQQKVGLYLLPIFFVCLFLSLMLLPFQNLFSCLFVSLVLFLSLFLVLFYFIKLLNRELEIRRRWINTQEMKITLTKAIHLLFS